jgi:uncharacterized protein YjiS (DUF1127 family)
MHIFASTERHGQQARCQALKALGKGIIMNVARSFNNWRKYRQTVSELGRMSNRALNDLGIDRSEIQRVARDATR